MWEKSFKQKDRSSQVKKGQFLQLTDNHRQGNKPGVINQESKHHTDRLTINQQAETHKPTKKAM